MGSVGFLVLSMFSKLYELLVLVDFYVRCTVPHQIEDCSNCSNCSNSKPAIVPRFTLVTTVSSASFVPIS